MSSSFSPLATRASIRLAYRAAYRITPAPYEPLLVSTVSCQPSGSTARSSGSPCSLLPRRAHVTPHQARLLDALRRSPEGVVEALALGPVGLDDALRTIARGNHQLDAVEARLHLLPDQVCHLDHPPDVGLEQKTEHRFAEQQHSHRRIERLLGIGDLAPALGRPTTATVLPHTVSHHPLGSAPSVHGKVYLLHVTFPFVHFESVRPH